MCLPPPGSTLFPYTTLFRSRRPCEREAHAAHARRVAHHDQRHVRLGVRGGARTARRLALESGRPVDRLLAARRERSEEHTSELQSHSDLVCRLLLEKKKK